MVCEKGYPSCTAFCSAGFKTLRARVKETPALLMTEEHNGCSYQIFMC